MIEFLSVAFALSLIANGVLYVVLDNYKKDHFELEKLNNALVESNRILSNKNTDLWNEVNNLNNISTEQKRKIQEIMEKIETYEFPIDSKVSWIDKKGDIEVGIVVDDSKIDGVTYVHLRRINKRGKILGGVISVPANKLKLEN